MTSIERLDLLKDSLCDCTELHTVIVLGEEAQLSAVDFHYRVVGWPAGHESSSMPTVVETDVAAILYTSGSTGNPKGVVFSHQNLFLGASSVCQYLKNSSDDRILGLLPLSFDAGLSQLTTAFHCGATIVLMNYLLPSKVVKIISSENITGLTSVPPVWIALANLNWSSNTGKSLRYIASTGGVMPEPTLHQLRTRLPNTTVYLMYGFTEAFRSTYLDPAELDSRPTSIGKSIPNAEILVINEEGQLCGPHEPGELVHCGPLVTQGYWNDPIATAAKFRPVERKRDEKSVTEVAAWSGDVVTGDEEGFLYFVKRSDELIKTSGYRVSPSEVEGVLYASGMVEEAAVFGTRHPTLGQAIAAVIVPIESHQFEMSNLLAACRQALPGYMVPTYMHATETLPRNANGKIDRLKLKQTYEELHPPE